jgi:hypothetical protein
MALAANFLGGARSRLLPPHIPFRFFGAAVVFHLFAWLAVLAGAPQFPRFAGGLGWPLAALHLLTLGVLVMTAIGASLQLLPVATRQPLRGSRAPALLWWLYTPGVALLTLGMGLGQTTLLGLGAAAVVAALLVYAVLLARNLHGARGMPVVVAHGWAALGALLLVLFTAVALVGNYLGWPLLERDTALALHLPFAAYGFMGLLSLGLSYILVPMFALSPAPDVRQALGSLALALLALALAATAALGVAPLALRVAAALLGAAAVLLHLRLMRASLRAGLRRELGPSFRLVRIGWALLLGSLGAALAAAVPAPWDGAPTMFVLLLVGGWLLTFLLGMLQRILPFLASMHASGAGRRGPTPSSLSASRPLAVHFAGHLVALCALALAIVADSARLAAIAAGVGALGAAAFALFFAVLLRRMRTQT